MNNEIWIPVKGLEGEYEVSNMGSVRGLDRYIDVKVDKKTGRFATKKQIELGDYKLRKKFVKARMLKPLRLSNGYVYVELKGKNRSLHRLVAEHFLIDETGRYMMVEHLNHNKKDNRVENLMWSDYKSNVIRTLNDGFWNNQYTKQYGTEN